MPIHKKENRINLLPRDEFEFTTAGKILAWLLSTFRLIVILTEIVVMAAFLSRFWLDAKNSDLNKKIEQKESQIRAFANFEKEFTAIQDRLSIYSALTSNQRLSSDTIKSIVPYLPPDVFLTSININQSEIKMNGFSPLERSIMQLLVNLRSIEGFKQVNLDAVNPNFENQGLIGFTISVNLSQ